MERRREARNLISNCYKSRTLAVLRHKHFKMWMKLLLLASCLALIQGDAVPDEEASSELSILSITDVVKFLAEHPKALRLTRTTKTKRSAVGRMIEYTITWTLGERKAGDGIATQNVSEWMWFGEPVNPKLVVTYPKSGNGGKIVTYVEVVVRQSTLLADCYVSEGGIGKRNIQIYILGYGTLFWSWDVKIYGLN